MMDVVEERLDRLKSAIQNADIDGIMSLERIQPIFSMDAEPAPIARLVRTHDVCTFGSEIPLRFEDLIDDPVVVARRIYQVLDAHLKEFSPQL